MLQNPSVKLVHIIYTDSSSYYLCSRNTSVRVPVTVSCGHVLLFYTLYEAERTATSPKYQSGGGTLCYTGHDTLSTTLHCHVGCFVTQAACFIRLIEVGQRTKERSTFTCYIAYIESYNFNCVTSYLSKCGLNQFFSLRIHVESRK